MNDDLHTDLRNTGTCVRCAAEKVEVRFVLEAEGWWQRRISRNANVLFNDGMWWRRIPDRKISPLFFSLTRSLSLYCTHPLCSSHLSVSVTHVGALVPFPSIFNQYLTRQLQLINEGEQKFLPKLLPFDFIIIV